MTVQCISCSKSRAVMPYGQSPQMSFLPNTRPPSMFNKGVVRLVNLLIPYATYFPHAQHGAALFHSSNLPQELRDMVYKCYILDAEVNCSLNLIGQDRDTRLQVFVEHLTSLQAVSKQTRESYNHKLAARRKQEHIQFQLNILFLLNQHLLSSKRLPVNASAFTRMLPINEIRQCIPNLDSTTSLEFRKTPDITSVVPLSASSKACTNSSWSGLKLAQPAGRLIERRSSWTDRNGSSGR